MAVAIGNHLTTGDVAERLGVSRGRVRQFHVRRQLVGEKVGTILLFPKSAVEAFASRHRPNGRPKQSRKSRK